jgi:hypothetical protein
MKCVLVRDHCADFGVTSVESSDNVTLMAFTYFSNLSYFLQQRTGEEIQRRATDDKTLLQELIMVTAAERKEATGI